MTKTLVHSFMLPRLAALLVFFCILARKLPVLNSRRWVDTLVRDEEDPQRVERRGLFGTTTYKCITRIVEHVWRFKVHWRVSAYVGTDTEAAVELKRRSGCADVRTNVASVELKGKGTGKGSKQAAAVRACRWASKRASVCAEHLSSSS